MRADRRLRVRAALRAMRSSAAAPNTRRSRKRRRALGGVLGIRSRCWRNGASRMSAQRSGSERDRRARCRERRHRALLEVGHLTKHYPCRAAVRPRAREGARGRRRELRDRRRRDAGPRRRERLRQIDASARRCCELVEPTAGAIAGAGERIERLDGREMRPYRRELQAVFQDPYASLNPRMRAADIVGRADPQLRARRRERDSRRAWRRCSSGSGLRPDQMATLSVRVLGRAAPAPRHRASARAAAPKLIVCDEPVSALDVSVQAQVINLLVDLQRDFGAVVSVRCARSRRRRAHQPPRRGDVSRPHRRARDRRASCSRNPQHPYTEALLSAVPVPDPDARSGSASSLPGDVPSPIDPPPGCRFHTRCPYAFDRCRSRGAEARGS